MGQGVLMLSRLEFLPAKCQASTAALLSESEAATQAISQLEVFSSAPESTRTCMTANFL